MTPESPLFPAYKTALELAAAAAAFNERANEAFDALFAEGGSEGQPARRAFDLVDASDVQSCLSVGSRAIPEGGAIARTFQRNDEEQPVRIELRPPYESFAYGDRIVESRFGLVSGGASRHQNVLRLVAVTQGATQAPDSRGYYVARSSRGTMTFFKIEVGDPPAERFQASHFVGTTATSQAAKPPTALEEAASGGRPSHLFQAKALELQERIAMLEEMEKAAAVLPHADRK